MAGWPAKVISKGKDVCNAMPVGTGSLVQQSVLVLTACPVADAARTRPPYRVEKTAVAASHIGASGIRGMNAASRPRCFSADGWNGPQASPTGLEAEG